MSRYPLLALAIVVGVTMARGASPDAKLAPWLSARLTGGQSEGFIVLFDDETSWQRALHAVAGRKAPARSVYEALTARARHAQAGVRAELAAAGIPFRPLYLVNGLAIRGDIALARKIAARSEVIRIVGDPVVRGIEAGSSFPSPAAPEAIEWGVSRINADDVWTLDGKRGEGIVVASADTGVEWNHPALLGKYRGWNGSVASHDYSWFDAIADTAVPLDDHNHGTHTTGTMVGGDGAANQIGVAPGARWIACRNMNHGDGQPSTYIACNQFFLAPFPHGGDPEADGDPSRAPDIVNNSWGCPPSEGCDAFVLEASFAALRAAGILAVAAAGNSGPSCSTVSDPPAIYDELLVSGATDSGDILAGFSSRGAVTVDGSGRMRPDVAAPGVSVRSSIRGATYSTSSGTSMASPHTSGAAALLWSAKPELRGLVGITRCVMSRAARPVVTLAAPQTCGNTAATDRPNNFWGYGLVDAYAAVHLGPDEDGDGIASPCDCASTNGGVHDGPVEVPGLGFDAAKTTLSWGSLGHQAGDATFYDVARGDLAILRALGTIDAAACLGAASNLSSRTDASLPPTGSGYYYVVRARNVCGDGGWGAGSDGIPRSHTTCP